MASSKKFSSILLCAALGFSLPAQAFKADFTTTAGFAKTCKAMPKTPEQLKTDDERVAFVICQDTAAVKQLITWGRLGIERLDNSREEGDSLHQTIITEVTKEIDYIRGQLASSRGVLEKIELGKKKSLRLVPSKWQLDLDGDGKMATWEKYFFAIPKRGRHPFAFSAPSDDPAYYAKEYNLVAAIDVDQSDILWSLAYHQFIEGLLTHVRAFDLDMARGISLVLSRPELLKNAHGLIGSGLQSSEKMRQSVMLETSNKGEWIGNPDQTASVFPIPLDGEDFATWGKVLETLDALWQGKTLLGTSDTRRGLLAGMIPACPEGQATNVAHIYQNPPAAGTVFTRETATQMFGAACQTIDDKYPLSELEKVLTQSLKTDAGMHFLRYLYWTN